MGREEVLASTSHVPAYGCWFAYISAALAVTICFAKPAFSDPWYEGLFAICLATFVIWLFSFYYSNSSIYDPAWCILPILISFGWISIAYTLPSARGVYCIVLLLIWFMRYTIGWPWDGWSVGLDTEDWRYKDMAEKCGIKEGGAAYWVASLVNLHMVPSLLVFFAVAPLQVVFVAGSDEAAPLNLQDLVAICVMLGCVIGNGVADSQLRAFREAATATQGQGLETTHCAKICRTGLWAYSRHPNYCCEAFFWFGIALAADAGDSLGAVPWQWAWSGSLIMLVFFRISSALMDARSLKHREGYGQLMKEVPAMLPGPVLFDVYLDRIWLPTPSIEAGDQCEHLVEELPR